MPLTANFAASQTLGEESIITLTDNSTGSDGSVTQRRVYLRKADGTFLVPDGTSTEYIVWAYADTSIDINVLPYDMALQIVVQWLNVSNSILYDKTETSGFTMYNETFNYGLAQMMAGNPVLINDNQFWSNKLKLSELIDSGDEAIALASDLYNAQQCYDMATTLRLKSQYTFNQNS